MPKISQSHDAIELSEIPIEGAEGQVTGFPSDLQR